MDFNLTDQGAFELIGNSTGQLIYSSAMRSLQPMPYTGQRQGMVANATDHILGLP